jgi:hypothetical protein
MSRLDILLATQRALRSRFDEFKLAFQRANTTAMGVALRDFEAHLVRWTEAEEKSLVPAVVRAGIEGRDPKRELRLQYVQIRELTRFIVLQIAEGAPLRDLNGYVENLDRRLHAHESEMERVYYAPASEHMTDEEWRSLESARPPD